MKKLTNGIIGLTIVIGLSGCGTTWVNLDKTKANETNVKKATNKCQYWQKLRKVNSNNSVKKLLINMQKTEEAKEGMRNHYKMEKQKVYDEADDCMKKEGFLKD
ncbi:MAG: hypothetical protein HRT40_03010 [Campylobacteraceae bacterium]|nr:hypothetical protein [Campylobacteraceae bacterium]